MGVQSKATIKSYFETGDKPTQAQFVDFIDSYQNASDLLTNFVSAAGAGIPLLTSSSAVSMTATGAFGLQFLAVPTSAAAKTALGITNFGVLPTVTVLTSAGSGTYSTPNGTTWLEIFMVGAGGGGGGSGSTAGTGGTGGNSTFSTLTASGGSGGVGNGGAGGAGGAATNGDYNQVGGTGGGGTNVGLNAGGVGGSTPMGSTSNPGGATVAGLNASNNSGAGASGSSGNTISSGGGGGGGGYIEKLISIPAVSYSYAIGLGGTAGTAGVGGQAGGVGGSGGIRIKEHYN